MQVGSLWEWLVAEVEAGLWVWPSRQREVAAGARAAGRKRFLRHSLPRVAAATAEKVVVDPGEEEAAAASEVSGPACRTTRAGAAARRAGSPAVAVAAGPAAGAEEDSSCFREDAAEPGRKAEAAAFSNPTVRTARLSLYRIGIGPLFFF